MPDRIPLAYTFGNHQHWVDMEWLWGYDVLPDSVADMLALCREAGVKGCVNFEGAGYEKMAAEHPEALAALRRAVEEGAIEPVGGSYGQPYGLFHGGESNVRQRVYGARAVRRLLGVWPSTFWEEEFDFHPQLPQILVGCGYRAASLFFQWTWHTPEIPKEEVPVVLWEGIDGSALPAATRNRLNLHQWPEDMDLLLHELAEAPRRDGPRPLVLQWLELNPSPDWMCRRELILPKLRELLDDPRFEVRPTTLGEYVRDYVEEAGGPERLEVRRYGLDDVWHGLTLGKNGDAIRRKSHLVEATLLEAEALAATLGLFGRPYAQWDVYPTWELEEAWRELLAAQHHDNDECEGLCGRVGWSGYEKAHKMARDVLELHYELLAERAGVEPGRTLVLEPLGWRRRDEPNGAGAFGWRVLEEEPPTEAPAIGGEALAGRRVSVSLAGGRPGPLRSEDGERELLAGPLLAITGMVEGRPVSFAPSAEGPSRDGDRLTWSLASELSSEEVWAEGALRLEPAGPGLEVTLRLHPLDGGEPDPGFAGAWRWPVRPAFPVQHVFVDCPYAVVEVGAGSRGKRKYPEGDWMTSPQWFEDVEGAITAQTFVDLVGPDGSGLLIVHDGSMQWFRRGEGFEAVLGAFDPWDEAQATAEFEATFWLIPHGPIDHAERWKKAQELRRRPTLLEAIGEGGDLPSAFSPVHVAPGTVVATAFYREMERFAGQHVPDYAGRGLAYPYVLRLVELAGEPAEVEVTVAGPVAAAFKTDLLGAATEALRAEPGDAASLTPETEALERFGIRAERLRLRMRPREIATLYLDLVPGRKRVRDLDARRQVWATVHRVDEPG